MRARQSLLDWGQSLRTEVAAAEVVLGNESRDVGNSIWSGGMVGKPSHHLGSLSFFGLQLLEESHQSARVVSSHARVAHSVLVRLVFVASAVPQKRSIRGN